MKQLTGVRRKSMLCGLRIRGMAIAWSNSQVCAARVCAVVCELGVCCAWRNSHGDVLCFANQCVCAILLQVGGMLGAWSNFELAFGAPAACGSQQSPQPEDLKSHCVPYSTVSYGL
jgi:hypothetical protein